MSARVFTTLPGLELRIGHYGTAAFDAPAVVPDEAARGLLWELAGCPVDGVPSREPRTDIRVELEAAAAPVVVEVEPVPEEAPALAPAPAEEIPTEAPAPPEPSTTTWKRGRHRAPKE